MESYWLMNSSIETGFARSPSSPSVSPTKTRESPSTIATSFAFTAATRIQFSSTLFRIEPADRCRCGLLNPWQRAKPVGFDPKHGIELAAEIFHCNDCCELDELFVGELPLQFFEECIGDALVRVGHALGELERQSLAPREDGVVLVISQNGFNLFRGRTSLHRTGCIDVNSERATVDVRRFDTDEVAELGRNQARRIDPFAERLDSFLNGGPKREH